MLQKIAENVWDIGTLRFRCRHARPWPYPSLAALHASRASAAATQRRLPRTKPPFAESKQVERYAARATQRRMKTQTPSTAGLLLTHTALRASCRVSSLQRAGGFNSAFRPLTPCGVSRPGAALRVCAAMLRCCVLSSGGLRHLVQRYILPAALSRDAATFFCCCTTLFPLCCSDAPESTQLHAPAQRDSTIALAACVQPRQRERCETAAQRSSCLLLRSLLARFSRPPGDAIAIDGNRSVAKGATVSIAMGDPLPPSWRSLSAGGAKRKESWSRGNS